MKKAGPMMKIPAVWGLVDCVACWVRQGGQARCLKVEECDGPECHIHERSGADCPLMKLVDMYFWQLGYEASGQGYRRSPPGIAIAASAGRD